MAQKYYNVAEAAEILGISEADVKQMLSRRELHGYRDGADWKFKVEDVDKISDERAEQGLNNALEEDGDMLLSDVELGASDPGASGTVIGMEGDAKPSADSDIKLGDDSDTAAAGGDDLGSKVAQFEELDLTLEEDLTLADSQAEPADGSGIELSADALEDDDLVLGGSGTGSDITIGGDSGISLVDPADSGLSLEEPLELAASGTELLELGEDDMISLDEETDTDAPTELKTDDDFLLTPLEEVEEGEDSESGSQVIALDTEGDEAATMVSDDSGGMAAMLDEDLSPDAADGLGVAAPLEPAAIAGAPLGAQPGGFAEGAAVAPAAVALPEAPYSVWNVLSLALCALFLAGCGMFMYDLLMHIWSWDEPYKINSSLMDMVLGWFE